MARTALAAVALGLAMAWSVGVARSQETPSVPPSIAITAPADGEVLPGPDITVQVAVTDFTIRPPCEFTGRCDESAREPSAGHIEYFLDVPPAFDQPTPLGLDNIIHSGRTAETFANVPPGEHTLYVCLAYSEHTCIGPSLTDSVRVTVGLPPPTPVPTATPEATPEPSATPEARPSATPEPPPPTAAPTKTPVLDGNTSETPSPTPTAALTATPVRPPSVEPTVTPVAGLAPSTVNDSGNGRSVNWALTLASASVVAIVALGLLTLFGVLPKGKR